MKKKVLIIDDDRTYRTITEKMLSNDGYEILMAENGKEGYTKAVIDQPDIIILDMIMPVEHGISTLDHLKSNEKTKDIPIIVWTNFTTSENLVEDKGIAKFIVKSEISNEEIIQKVNEVIGEANA